MKTKINRVNLLANLSPKTLESVPIAPGVDLSAIKDGDSNPMEVVVEIPASKSKRGWVYQPAALRDIVEKVNTDTLNGFLGHQKAENVDTEFPDIQTHWIGAIFDDASNTAFFRGVIDPTATKLKRWIKAKRIKQVSIFGRPKLQTIQGEINVVGYEPMSIDWTPLDRPGMPTQVVVIGEMATMYDSTVDSILFDGEIEEVELGKEEEDNGGKKIVTKEEVLAELKTKFTAGEILLADVQPIVGEIASVTPALLEVVGEMSIEDVRAAITLKAESDTAAEKKVFGEMVQGVIDAKITSPVAKKFVSDLFAPVGKTKEELVGELDTFLAKESISTALNKMFDTTSIFHRGAADNHADNVRVKRVQV